METYIDFQYDLLEANLYHFDNNGFHSDKLIIEIPFISS